MQITIIFIVILFILYYIKRGKIDCACPSTKNNTKMKCYRFEIYGLQINHLLFYTIIGFCYPNYFYTWQLLGLIWELIESIPIFYPFILNYIGGCIDKKHKINIINPIDSWIYVPKNHFWHPKLSDLLLNLIGFKIGSFIKKI